jgi:predicted permease
VSVVVTDRGYFGTIGIPLQAGRVFDNSDRHRLQVAVVAASVGEHAWPGRDAVGQRFRIGRDDAPLIEVVGVVGDVRGIGLTANPTLDVYLPYCQSDMVLYSDQMSVVVRTVRGPPEDLSAIRTAIREAAPTLPLPAFRTMDDIATASVAERRFEMDLVLLIGVVAMMLAGIGIYGVVSHAVARRTNEIGIRMALGAQPRAVRRLVFTQSILPVAAGLTAGLIASMLLGRLLRSLLFETRPTDLLTMLGATALLGAVAAVAIYLPARRAVRIDPIVALRSE